MRTSWRKAVRDLRRQRTQVGAVVLTVMLGVTLYVATGGAFRNLSTSYLGTYHRLGMADLVATGTNPQALADAASAAGAATTRVRAQVDLPMTIDGSRLLGRLVGMPAGSHPAVDDVQVIAGGYLSAGEPDGVLVEKHAAATFGLVPGDTLQVATPAGWHQVTVRGVVVSPEYLWPARSRQDLLGDPHDFAVVLASEAQVEAWSGQPADQALVLVGTADPGTVTAAMTTAGAADVVTLADNASDAALHLDLSGFRQMSIAFPLMFLTAATVAAYVLLTRRVLSERPVIGTLMAAGARRGRVVGHFVLQGPLVGAAGSVLGAALGIPLTALVTREYTAELGILDTVVVGHPDLVAIGAGLGLVVGVLGSALPALAAAGTPPAEAMRNQADLPRPGPWSALVARLRWLPATTRMALRDVVRSPRRTLATMLGAVLGLVLVLAAVGLMTSMLTALDTQFSTVERQDASVLVGPGDAGAVTSRLTGIAGVAAVEPSVTGQVTIVFGGATYTTQARGFDPGTTMHGFRSGGHTVALPADGVLAGQGLAERLHVAPGDELTVRDAAGAVSRVRLVALIEEPLGTSLYGTTSTVDRLVTDPATALLVRFDPGTSTARRDAVRQAVTGMDQVLAYTDTRALVGMVHSYLGLFWAFVGVVVVLGGVLALAVIQVTMSVNLAERTTELATLRAAGVAVRRAAGVLATENLVSTALGVPIGLVAGVLAARGMLGLFSSDMFTLPLDLPWWVLALAAAGVLLAAAASQLPAAQAIRRLDVARAVRERAL